MDIERIDNVTIQCTNTSDVSTPENTRIADLLAMDDYLDIEFDIPVNDELARTIEFE